MAVDSYSALKSAIGTYLGDTAQDSNRDDFIDLFEAWANRVLRHTAMEEQTTLTTNSSGLATLPTGYLDIRSVRYSASPSRELKPLSIGSLNRLSPYDTAGTVYAYTITSISNVQKIRIIDPLDAASLVVTYFEKIPALSDSQTTNWLLDLSPDLYFYGSLAQAYAWRRQFEVAAGLQAKAQQVVDEISSIDERGRYGNAEIVLPGVNP